MAVTSPDNRWVPPPATAPDRRDRDDLIPLSAYLAVWWRYRLFVLGITVLAGAVAWAWTGLVRPNYYEARASLIVDAPGLALGTPAVDAAMTQVKAVFEDQTTTQAIIEQLGLGKPPHYQTAATLFRQMVTLESIPGTAILELRAQTRDPQLSATLVNRIGNNGIELHHKAVAQRVAAAKADLESVEKQRDATKTELDAATGQFVQFRSSAQLEVRKREAEVAAEEREEIEGINVQLAMEQARRTAAQAELAKRSRTFPVRRSVDDRSDRSDSRGASRAAASADVQDASVREEQPDPVYAELDKWIAESTIQIEGLRRKQDMLVARQKTRNAPASYADVFSKEEALRQRRAGITQTENAYNALEAKARELRSHTEQPVDVRFASRAVPPTAAVNATPMRSGILTAVYALILASVGAFVLHFAVFPRPRAETL